MNSRSSESEVVRRVVAHLMGDGYRVRTEVPNMAQSADIVATRNRYVMFIEAKVNDWRRALRQCRSHELVADYICIAVGLSTVTSLLRSEMEQAGYGLLHCPPGEQGCRLVVKPKRNHSVWGPQRQHLSRALGVIEYEH